MAVTLRYFTEFGKNALQKTIMAEFMQKSIVFLVRVQCRRKESSRSLSHPLMSFLFYFYCMFGLCINTMHCWLLLLLWFFLCLLYCFSFDGQSSL